MKISNFTLDENDDGVSTNNYQTKNNNSNLVVVLIVEMVCLVFIIANSWVYIDCDKVAKKFEKKNIIHLEFLFILYKNWKKKQ